MSSSLVNKVLDIIGLGDDEFDVADNSSHDEEYGGSFLGAKEKKNKVVSIHSNTGTKVIVCSINGFDEVTRYCDYLKQEKLVLMDFKKVDHETAQRCVDFLGGALYTINGYIQEISPGIVLLAPKSFDLSCDIKDKLSDSGDIMGSKFLNWFN